ncbi:MAG TPA: hypothetical protein GX530_03545 [Corynebacteriales bacterium]|nr:hypothetical protein [Mycobacteriales bacterium]
MADQKKSRETPPAPMSRRRFLAGGTAIASGLLLGSSATAEALRCSVWLPRAGAFPPPSHPDFDDGAPSGDS